MGRGLLAIRSTQPDPQQALVGRGKQVNVCTLSRLGRVFSSVRRDFFAFRRQTSGC